MTCTDRKMRSKKAWPVAKDFTKQKIHIQNIIMKKLTAIALSMLMTITSFAEKEKIVKSKIESVTVFLQGAQIHRKSKIYAEKGVTKIVIEGISHTFNKNSIQVKGKGKFIILDVSSKVFYPTPEPVKVNPTDIPKEILKEISLLEDSLQVAGWKVQSLVSEIATYKMEREMLLTSGVIKGQVSNDSIAALKEAMVYMRSKLLEINKIILKKEKLNHAQNAIQTRISYRLQTLKNYNTNVAVQNPKKDMSPVQQIIVTVSSDEATSGYLYVSYMLAATSAGWSPSYDLRADDINSPIKLTYKANVYQNTGNNWDEVDLTLSTINPNRSNVKPTLAPWYVSYYQPIQQYNSYGRSSANKPTSYQLDDLEITDNAAEKVTTSSGALYSSQLPQAQHASNFTQMTESMAMVEFELKIPYSIPSDGQYHLMAVKSDNIESSFEHFVIPKLDKDAYLVAHLTGWEELNLLPAVANVYYDGTYVGQTRINPSVMSDTLDLALGRDRGIYITRKKTDDVENVKKLASEKTKTITYEIAIKNFKNSEINLTIEDQIPISNNEEIEVTLEDKGKAAFDKKTGKLTWKRVINAKETEKLRFTYQLKFDKNKTLASY